jgi:hypothetical protein
MDGYFRNYWLGTACALVVMVLLLVGCAQSTVQTVGQFCSIYSSTLISLTGFKHQMTAGQIASVDTAVALIAPTCEGAIPEGEPGVFLEGQLDTLESLLLKLQEANNG